MQLFQIWLHLSIVVCGTTAKDRTIPDRKIFQKYFKSNSNLSSVFSHTLKFCAQTCLQRSPCQSICYSHSHQKCLHYSSPLPTEDSPSLIESVEYVSSNISTWGKNFVGGCVERKCPANTFCVSHDSRTYMCLPLGINCSTLPEIKGTSSSLLNGTANGSMAVYTCVRGHTYLPGANTTKCKPEITYEAIKCSSKILAIDGASATQPNGTQYGSVAKYSCHKNRIYESGDNISRCGAGGKWSNATIKCKIIDCGNPPAIDGGSATQTNGTQYGSVAKYSCHENRTYETGDNISRCGAGGKWSNATIKCKIIDCGNPPAIDGASATQPNGTQYGSVAKYSCHENRTYETGDNISRCGAGGKWSNATIKCKKSCPSMDPTGYTYNKSLDLCYQLKTSSMETWDDASLNCKKDGGMLITVDTTERNQFVYQISRPISFIYIGCQKDQMERRWKWSDGSLVTWSNWQSHNIPSESGCCQLTFSNDWRVTDCQLTLRFVCEIKL